MKTEPKLRSLSLLAIPAYFLVRGSSAGFR